MKNSPGIFLSTLTVMGMLHAQAQAQAKQEPDVCVSSLISIAAIQDPLNFATLTPCLSFDGSLELKVNGNTKVNGCIDGTSGIVQLGKVRVRGGQDSKKVRITVSLPINQIQITNGPQILSITDINMKPGGQNRDIKGTETETFDIGGILHVSASQPGGTYTGNFTIDAVCEEE